LRTHTQLELTITNYSSVLNEEASGHSDRLALTLIWWAIWTLEGFSPPLTQNRVEEDSTVNQNPRSRLQYCSAVVTS